METHGKYKLIFSVYYYGEDDKTIDEKEELMDKAVLAIGRCTNEQVEVEETFFDEPDFSATISICLDCCERYFPATRYDPSECSYERREISAKEIDKALKGLELGAYLYDEEFVEDW